MWERRAQVAVAALLVLAIALPWPVYMVVKHADFVVGAGDEMIGKRFLSLDAASPVKALLRGFLLLFPWTVVALPAFG